MVKTVETSLGQNSHQDDQKNSSAAYWAVDSLFLSQSYTNAKNIYMLQTTELGPFSYEIPPEYSGVTINEPVVKKFTIEAEYCSHYLFAPGNSSYIGQPILGILAKDKNEAQEIAAHIKVTYAEPKTTPITLDNFTDEDVLSEIKLISENFDQETQDQSYESLSFEYFIPKQINKEKYPYGAYAVPEGLEKIRIYVTTDWPTHVHENLVNCLGLKSENIILIPLRHSKMENDLIIEPTLWACYVAIATWKTKKPTKISFPSLDSIPLATSAEGLVRINLALQPSSMSIAYTIDIILSAGYYGYLIDELAEQILYLFFKFYEPNIYNIRIRSIVTNEPPKGPFLSLASTYIQSMISLTLNFLGNRYGTSLDLIYEKILTHDMYLQATLEKHFIQLNQMIDFERKSLAYHLQAVHQSTIFLHSNNCNTLGLKGIGRSCAIGPNGLILPQYQKLSARATLHKNGEIVIHLSCLPNEDKKTLLWAEMIANYLDIDIALVKIYADPQLKNGPYALGLSMTTLTPLVIQLATKLYKKSLNFDGNYPLNVNLSYENYQSLKTSLDPIIFSSLISGTDRSSIQNLRMRLTQKHEEVSQNEQDFCSLRNLLCIGNAASIPLSKEHYNTAIKTAYSILTCALELYIDPTSLEIRIEDLAFVLSCGAVEDYDLLHASMLKTVHDTLYWLLPSLNTFLIPDFKLVITEDPSHPYPLSINEIIESTLVSAYLTALSQALNYEFKSFPVSAEDIFDILNAKVVTH